MPIGDFEREVLQRLAANRSPESFVAGATVLNQGPESPRASQDIDFFHDSMELLKKAAESDLRLLGASGYSTEILLREEAFVRAVVRRGAAATKVEWAHDSAFRFFPVEPDPELGWRLNFWDAATNKVLAFAGRAKARDFIDVVHLHEHRLAFGALAWAAAGKDAGLSPEMVVEFAQRNSCYRPEDFERLHLNRPMDLHALKRQFMDAATEARALFGRLPPEDVGCLYLDPATHSPVAPDPDSPIFAKLTRHFGSFRGAWPQIIEED
jgi:hypothetical protein